MANVRHVPTRPIVDVERIREAVLALEGTVISDLVLPLPGDLKDLPKAAALVSGVVEDRLPELLNRVRSTTWDRDDSLHAYEFRKFPIGFPDVLLVERADPENIVFEIEAKSWYALSSDALTARFETATSVIRPGTLIVIVAWILDGVVSGSPRFLRVLIDDAHRLAVARDQAWASLETRRVRQPSNPPGTPRNLLVTKTSAETLRDGNWVAESENFGKLERLHDGAISDFAGDVADLVAAGKTLRQWRRFIKEPLEVAPTAEDPNETVAAAQEAASLARDAAVVAESLAERLRPRRRRRRT